MCAQQGPRILDPRLHTACPPCVAGAGEVNANEVTISLFYGKSESHSNDDDVSFRPFRDNRPRKYDTGMGGAPAGSRRKFHNTAHSAGTEGGSARVSPSLASPEPRQAHPSANTGCAPRASACEVQILSSGRETKRIGRRSQCRGHLILLRIADHSETRQIDGKKRGASTVDFGARIHCRSSLQRDGS